MIQILYIDATAGGLLLQVLLGGTAGLAVVGRLFWGRMPWRRDSSDSDLVTGAGDGPGDAMRDLDR